MMKYGQGAGRGQWGTWGQGGLRRGPKTSPERGGAGFRPPIGRAVGRLSRSIQFSPFVGIENSPSPWLSRRLLGAHQAGFELLFEPVGVAADIQGDGMVQDAV